MRKVKVWVGNPAPTTKNHKESSTRLTVHGKQHTEPGKPYLYPVHRIKGYFKYLLQARGRMTAHSPKLFELFNEVFNSEVQYYFFEDAEKERARLLTVNAQFEMQDHGAGSKKLRSSSRSIQQVAKTSLKRPKYAQLMYRLTRHEKRKHVLELGTSLGITTSYIAKAAEKVTSVEGDPTIHTSAKSSLEKLKCSNVRLVNSTFNTFIDELKPEDQFDLIFIDGHHEGSALQRYFDALLPHLTEDGIMVLDDIHWSPDMTKAWKVIKTNPRFNFKLDLFEMGILLPEPGSAIQEHSIRY